MSFKKIFYHYPLTVVGNFGNNRNPPNGQTIKSLELVNFLSCSGLEVNLLNTSKRVEFLSSVWRFFLSERVIFIPGSKFMCIFWIFSLVHQRLHGVHSYLYCVAVGGWLPDFFGRYWYVRKFLSFVRCTFVQSARMEIELSKVGVRAKVLKNFRDLVAAVPRELSVGSIRLLFLSRVRRDKGIVQAVDLCERLRKDGKLATLTICGPIYQAEYDEIHDLMAREFVSYLDPVNSAERVIELMREHDFFVFPTRYAGEGIPGVLVESLFAGLPVVCSDWIDLAEIVDDGVTGFLVPLNDFVARGSELIRSLDASSYRELSVECLKKSVSYRPEVAGAVLLREINRQ